MYRWFLTWNIIVYIVSQVSLLHLLFSMKTVKSYSTRCDPSILLFYNLIHGILHSQYQCLLWSIGWRYCFISNKLQTIEKICGDITIDWCIHIKIIEILMKLLPTKLKLSCLMLNGFSFYNINALSTQKVAGGGNAWCHITG